MPTILPVSRCLSTDKFKSWSLPMSGIGSTEIPAGCGSDYTQLRMAPDRLADIPLAASRIGPRRVLIANARFATITIAAPIIRSPVLATAEGPNRSRGGRGANRRKLLGGG